MENIKDLPVADLYAAKLQLEKEYSFHDKMKKESIKGKKLHKDCIEKNKQERIQINKIRN